MLKVIKEIAHVFVSSFSACSYDPISLDPILLDPIIGSCDHLVTRSLSLDTILSHPIF